MKIYINYEDKNVSRNLQDGIRAINKAKNTSVNIPSGFRYASTVSRHVSEIVKIASSLESVDTWLQNSSRDYEQSVQDLKNELNEIENIDIKKNISIIK